MAGKGAPVSPSGQCKVAEWISALSDPGQPKARPKEGVRNHLRGENPFSCPKCLPGTLGMKHVCWSSRVKLHPKHCNPKA